MDRKAAPRKKEKLKASDGAVKKEKIFTEHLKSVRLEKARLATSGVFDLHARTSSHLRSSHPAFSHPHHICAPSHLRFSYLIFISADRCVSFLHIFYQTSSPRSRASRPPDRKKFIAGANHVNFNMRLAKIYGGEP